MFFWCFVLCACFLSPALSRFPDSQILYKYDQSSSFSHQVSIRQTDEGEARGHYQRQGRQIQQCQGPGRLRGRCVSIESCVLQDIYKDYIKNKEYFCVLKNQRGIGVCCPENITAPVAYQDGMFRVSSGSASGGATSRPTVSSAPIRFPGDQQQPSTTTASTVPNRISGSSGENALNDAYPSGDWRVCGRNGKKLASITAGAPTTVKDWPWMTALLYRQTLKQFCGGTLITRRHVLTAAHCFPRREPSEFLALLGDYSLKSKDDSKSRLFTVDQIIVHEDFDVTTFEYDIAIVVMNATTIYNSYIQPCCLPAPGPRYPNLTAVVTGWGKTEFGGPSSDILMEVPVPIWEQQRCTPNFAQTIFNTNLCAGAFEGGKDACQGDSGGPLVTQRNDDRWTIVGLVSWGVRCGEKNKPGIYTRINDYLDWISQTIL